jgi:hypothetical protein
MARQRGCRAAFRLASVSAPFEAGAVANGDRHQVAGGVQLQAVPATVGHDHGGAYLQLHHVLDAVGPSGAEVEGASVAIAENPTKL